MTAKFSWAKCGFVLVPTIISWLVTPLCSAMEDQRNLASNCDPGESFYSTLFTFRCCHGEGFTYGHLLNFMDQCAVPPLDQRLSLSTSQWLLFECLISKSLQGKPLTLTNFANIMATNLTIAKKSAVLSKLTNNNNNEKMGNSAVGKNNFAKIRTIWTKYFEAEFQICFIPSPPPVDQRFNQQMEGPPDQKPTAGEWAPQNDCGGPAATATSPDIPILAGPFPGMAGCLNNFWDQHDLTNVSRYDRPAMFLCCELIQSGLLKESDLEIKNLDYQSLMRKIFPKFWSTNTKDVAIKEFPWALQLAMDLGNGKGYLENQQNDGESAKNLADMIRPMRVYAETLLKSLHVHKDSDQFYINFFMLSIIDVALDQIKQPLCRT